MQTKSLTAVAVSAILTFAWLGCGNDASLPQGDGGDLPSDDEVTILDDAIHLDFWRKSPHEQSAPEADHRLGDGGYSMKGRCDVVNS